MRPVTECIRGGHGLLALTLVAVAAFGPAAAQAVTFEEAAQYWGYTYESTHIGVGWEPGIGVSWHGIR